MISNEYNKINKIMNNRNNKQNKTIVEAERLQEFARSKDETLYVCQSGCLFLIVGCILIGSSTIMNCGFTVFKSESCFMAYNISISGIVLALIGLIQFLCWLFFCSCIN